MSFANTSMLVVAASSSTISVSASATGAELTLNHCCVPLYPIIGPSGPFGAKSL